MIPGMMPLAASRLPTLGQGQTLGNAATVGNPQAANAQAQQLAALLAQHQQAQAGMDLGAEMQGADYIKDSGSLGVLAALANRYMGGRIRRREGETAADLTQRILQAQTEAERAKMLEDEQRKAATERADYERKLGILRSGDANAIAAAGLKAPEQPKQEFQFYDSADGPMWIPKPTGEAPALGDDVLPQMEFDTLRAAVEQVESGGNPNAVSPKGAVGRMQTMPATLRDPGFGVTPARDGSDAELTRVGTDYLRAMIDKYADPRLALAAYNWGPGNVDAAMQQSGGNVDAVLAGAPKETQDYVRKVSGLAQPQTGGLRAIPVAGVRGKPKDAAEWERKIAYLTEQGYSPQQAIQMVMGGRNQRISINPDTGEVSIEEGMPGGLTNASTTRTQGEVQQAQDALAQLERVGDAISDKYLTFGGLAKGKAGRVMDRAGLTNDLTQFNADRGAALQEVEQFFNTYRKLITGAAAAEKELQALREATINSSLGPQEFNARYGRLVDSLKSDISRKQSQLGAPKPEAPSAPKVERRSYTVGEVEQKLKDARAAVAQGADKAAVQKRLRDMGLVNIAGRL